MTQKNAATAPAHAAPGDRGAGGWALVLLLALAGMLPYLQSVTYGLVRYDDPWLIGENLLLRRPGAGDLQRIWLDLSPQTRLRLGAEYLPVRDMSVLLDHLVFGRWYGGFHLTNVLLYGLLCGLTGLVISRWTGRERLAWIAGLLFALHPLHAESVAWLSERKGLLAGLLLMAGALAFRSFVLRPSLLRWAATAMLLVLATWSKAVGAVGVVFLAALTWFVPAGPGARSTTCPVPPQPKDLDRSHKTRQLAGSGSGRPVAWGLAGLAVLTAAAFVPVWVVGRSLVVQGAHHGGSLGATLWLMARVQAVYLKHLLLGGELGLAYEVPSGPAGIAAGVSGALGAIILAGLALFGVLRWRAHPRRAGVGLAAATWWIFFLPVSQLVFPLQNVLADRYMLLPSLALCLLAGEALEALSIPWLRYGLLLVTAALAAGLSFMQARSWSDTRALCQQALRANPSSETAMVQLAELEIEKGRMDRAEAWLRRAEQARPKSAHVALHRGLLLCRMGHTAGCIRHLGAAIRRDPGADKAMANLALVLARTGRGDEALQLARRAVSIRSMAGHNQRTLGVVALGRGLTAEAEAAFAAALRLEPQRAINHYNMAVVALEKGRRQQAARCLRRALELRPGYDAARRLLLRTKDPGAEGDLSR